MNWTMTGLGGLSLAALSLNLSGCSKAAAQSERVDDRSVELTVYKSDFAEIRDTRDVNLNGQSTHVELTNVSKTLDPKSVIFEWPGQKDREVTSNTYDLGVGSSDGLLKRFVGREVEFVWRSNNGSEGQRIKGTLELADGGVVLKVGDKYYVNPDGTIIAPGGDRLVTSPTLSADVQSSNFGPAKLRTSYLSRGMSWSADYVGTISPDSNMLDLVCWASITNQTGVEYPSAKITLVTGSPNVALADGAVLTGSGREMSGYAGESNTRASVASAPVAAPTATGELYSYEVKAPATIGQNQMNRVRMLSADRVPIKRDYSIELSPGLGDGVRQNAQMAISFTNSKSAGLGKPLPQGSVRVYESSRERQTYVGGSDIRDVPKDDKVVLTLSDCIDLYSRSSVTKTVRENKHQFVRSYHADLYNEKPKDMILRLVFSSSETSKLVSESSHSVRKDAATFEWKVEVPAGRHVPLDFSIRARG